MGHPLKKYANLILLVNEPIGQVTFNPETGNYDQTTVERRIECYVQEGMFRDFTAEIAGNNRQVRLLEGYLVNPKFYPPYFKQNQPIKAILIDPQTKQEFRGEFIPEMKTPQPFKAVTKVLGNEVKGLFNYV